MGNGGVLHWAYVPKMETSAINSWVCIIACSVYPHHHRVGRETYLFPVTWESGWPVFNNGKPLAQHLKGVLVDKSPLKEYYNDFSASHTLDNTFYFLRTPYKPFYSLTSRHGYLRINANSYALGDRDNPAVLLHKQTSYEETFEVLLEFQPSSNLTEAGITVFNGDQLHNDIAIVGGAGSSGERYVRTRTIVQATQVGPWSLTYTNNTITTVSLSSNCDVPLTVTCVGYRNTSENEIRSSQAYHYWKFNVIYDGLCGER